MSKQRRFQSEAEILKAIDAANADLKDKRRQRQGMYDTTKIDRSIKRIEEVKLKKLGEALSAIRTQTFPFVEDKSVVLR